MQMRRAARLSDLADLIPTRHTIASVQQDAGGIEMTVHRKDDTAIRKDVPHDDDALIRAPAQRVRIRHHPVPDAIDRCA